MRSKMILTSSVSKKIYMSIAGIVWTLFITIHLLGNLQLLKSDPDPFNKYSYFLTEQTGEIIYVVEFFLAFFLLILVVYGIWIQIDNWLARPKGYSMVRWAHHTSKRSIGSVTMIYTGLLILLFIIIHLFNFKYGTVYMYTPQGFTHPIRDLHKTVILFFQNPWNVTFYVVMMAVLGFHLSHAIWSSFQSLGFGSKRFTPFWYGVGLIWSIIVAVGFIILPLWIHFRGGAL